MIFLYTGSGQYVTSCSVKLNPLKTIQNMNLLPAQVTILGLHRIEQVRFIIPLLSIATVLNYGSQAKATDFYWQNCMFQLTL